MLVGYPRGLTKSFLDGMVSSDTVIASTGDNYSSVPALVISAPVNPGNSGGPVFCTRSKKVVAVACGYHHSKGVATPGVNYAIPTYLLASTSLQCQTTSIKPASYMSSEESDAVEAEVCTEAHTSTSVIAEVLRRSTNFEQLIDASKIQRLSEAFKVVQGWQ